MKIEVFSFLESKKISLDEQKEKSINEVKKYFKAFFPKYSAKNIESLKNMNNIEIFTPLIILSNPFNIDKVLTNITKYSYLFTDKNFEDKVISLAMYYLDKDIRALVDASFSSNPFLSIPAIFNLPKAFLVAGTPIDDPDGLFILKEKPGAKEELKHLFGNLTPEFFNTATSFITAQNYYKATDNVVIIGGYSQKEQRKLNKIINDQETKDFNEQIKAYLNFLNHKYQELISAYEKEIKKSNKRNDNLDKLQRMLDTDQEIKNIAEILQLCSTDEEKEIVINYISEHNKAIYLELIREYENKRDNSDENLNILFKKYGFNYNNLTREEKEELKKLAFLTIEDLLKRLKALNIYNLNVSKVSLKKLTTLEELVTKGIITNEWLQLNGNIILLDNNLLDIILLNLTMLSQEGINMLQYRNSLDIIKSPLLKENLALLKSYDLTITKSTTALNFLVAPDLRLRIEFIYSLGLYQELTDLNILNNSLEDLLKIKIDNYLNIPVITITDLRDIYYDFATNIIPENIKDKLQSASLNTIAMPLFLEPYQIDKQTINLNGIYVSTTKIKRNLAKLESISPENCFYAIIFNGFYTLEEIEKLKEVLMPLENLSRK